MRKMKNVMIGAMVTMLSCILPMNMAEAEQREKNLNLPQQVSLSTEEVKAVESAKKVALFDGEGSAQKISMIKNKDKYQEAVSEVLNQYYHEKSVNPEVKEFTKSIRNSGRQIVGEYQDALKERTDENLKYDATKLIVEFNSDVAEKSVEEVMDAVSDGGYMVFDQFEIDSALPKEKRERIQDAINNSNKIAVVNVDKGHTTKTEIKQYEQLQGVAHVTRNVEIESEGITNDTYIDRQWHLDNKISFTWSAFNTKKPYQSNIYVAVIDNDFDISHGDLQGQFIDSKTCDVTDGYKRLSQLQLTDLDEHGTHVAGIINAKTNNSRGVAGIASICEANGNTGYFNKCKLMGLKVADKNNNMLSTYVLNAIGYAITNGADIINMSLGSYTESGLQPVINAAYQAGVTVIAAAGNDNTSQAFYPAAYDHVISVASVDKNQNKSSFSNYGSSVDIAAPGSNIFSTVPGGYMSMSGTSMAAPYVTGVAALMKQADSSLTPNEIESKLKQYATALADGNKQCGAGIISLPSTALSCLK